MKALITGITGQDGYFLNQFLLEKGYDVYGIVWRNSNRKMGNLELLPERIKKEIHIFEGDVTDTNSFIADYSKGKRLLNWYPKTSFRDLVKIMVKYNIEHYKKA